jgi:hypothetical protein
MQAFYPASSWPRPSIWGLVVLVFVLHLLGLQTLSTSLSGRDAALPAPVAHLRLSAPPPTAAVELKPLAAVPTSKQTPVAKVVAPPSAGSGATARLDMADKPEDAPSSATPVTEPVEAATAPAIEPAMPEAPLPEPVVPTPVETPPTPTPATVPAPAPPAPASTAAPPWLAQARFVWPAPVLLNYELSGTSKGVKYTANASISWKYQDNSYQLRHEIKAFLFGNRSQTSAGQVGAMGLLPTRFGDQFRQEQAAHFDRAKDMLIYSANTPSQAIEEGAQDRVSLFVQLAGAMAGTPGLRAEGQQFGFQVVSAKQAEVWSFAVLGSEKIKLPLGELDSLKIHRIPRNEYDQKLELWLSPSHGYLPARLRIIQANGDVIEETLKSLGKP